MVMMTSDIAVSNKGTMFRMSTVVIIVDDDPCDFFTEASVEPLSNSLVF